MLLKRIQTAIILTMAVLALAGFKTAVDAATNKAPTIKETGTVVSITDGDTYKVLIKGKKLTIRLVGADTPEIKDPRKDVQCFGVEASKHAKELLLNKKVTLMGDAFTGNKDNYGRYLRYVYLEDGTNINRQLISDGYAYAYAANGKYNYEQKPDFKNTQQEAQDNKRGLWSDDTCKGVATPMTTKTITTTTTKANTAPAVSSQTTGCVIKGNISNKEKIYHLPGCQSYKATIIDEKAGEKWFCTEDEAVKAGWRKAKNC